MIKASTVKAVEHSAFDINSVNVMRGTLQQYAEDVRHKQLKHSITNSWIEKRDADVFNVEMDFYSKLGIKPSDKISVVIADSLAEGSDLLAAEGVDGWNINIDADDFTVRVCRGPFLVGCLYLSFRGGFIGDCFTRNLDSDEYEFFGIHSSKFTDEVGEDVPWNHISKQSATSAFICKL